MGGQGTSSISAMGQPAYQFRIGRTSNGYYPLNGSIDDVRVFNATIPTSQIRKQYYAGLNKLLASGGITKKEYQNKIKELITAER